MLCLYKNIRLAKRGRPQASSAPAALRRRQAAIRFTAAQRNAGTTSPKNIGIANKVTFQDLRKSFTLFFLIF